MSKEKFEALKSDYKTKVSLFLLELISFVCEPKKPAVKLMADGSLVEVSKFNEKVKPSFFHEFHETKNALKDFDRFSFEEAAKVASKFEFMKHLAFTENWRMTLITSYIDYIGGGQVVSLPSCFWDLKLTLIQFNGQELGSKIYKLHDSINDAANDIVEFAKFVPLNATIVE